LDLGDFYVVEFMERMFTCVGDFNPFGDGKFWMIFIGVGK